MKTIAIQTKTRGYDVLIGKGLLKEAGKTIARMIQPCTAAIITDDNVERLYGAQTTAVLHAAGFRPLVYAFKSGEDSKNLTVYTELLEFLAENNVTRSDIIIALGGGVVGDMAGFCASTYLRGIRYVQIPTTFLSAIDSSVGGKTGVNLKAGKNLAGVFYQPELVCCDISLLNTLPEKYFADGIAEAVKYGMIADENLFHMVSSLEMRTQLEEITERCVQIKNGLVSLDEFDKGARQLLNFGHTLGHAIEKCSNFTVTHGHAVGIGMVATAKAAYAQGISEQDCTEPIKEALLCHGLPVDLPYPVETLLPAIMNDKKRAGDSITLVVPKKIGCCILHKISVSQLPSFFGL
ncbi:MAG: 3-dehydroquinate synthase [Christensenellales bacterium]